MTRPNKVAGPPLAIWRVGALPESQSFDIDDPKRTRERQVVAAGDLLLREGLGLIWATASMEDPWEDSVRPLAGDPATDGFKSSGLYDWARLNRTKLQVIGTPQSISGKGYMAANGLRRGLVRLAQRMPDAVQETLGIAMPGYGPGSSAYDEAYTSLSHMTGRLHVFQAEQRLDALTISQDLRMGVMPPELRDL